MTQNEDVSWLRFALRSHQGNTTILNGPGAPCFPGRRSAHRDARLSFTTDMGYRPNGIALPAWTAVFFNPKTDLAVIDRLVASIEELV